MWHLRKSTKSSGRTKEDEAIRKILMVLYPSDEAADLDTIRGIDVTIHRTIES